MQQGSATRPLALQQHEPGETAPLGIVAGDPGAGEVGQWPRPAYAWSVENSIYVAPGRQRSGVGRALLQALIEIATARGFRQMVAVIGDSGQRGSIGLHRALGFAFCGNVH